MKILDVSGGRRMMWFDQRNPLCTFLDIRQEMEPDVVADSTQPLPFDKESFDLVVFDPPHLSTGRGARMAKTYGHMPAAKCRQLVEDTARQIRVVLKPDGLLCFRWCDHTQRLERILGLLHGFEPLFGHKVAERNRRRSSLYWIVLRRTT